MRRTDTSEVDTKQRHIVDIFLAIKTTAMVLAVISIFGAMLGGVASLVLAGDSSWIFLGIPLAWLASAPFVFRVWFTYYDGIAVDVANDCLSFPASDVESGLLEIITLRRFFNHGKTERLPLSSVEAAMNETRTSKGWYAINLSGGFGSRQLVFDSKQKRDEFRAAVEWGIRQVGGRLRRDINIDTGVFGG